MVVEVHLHVVTTGPAVMENLVKNAVQTVLVIEARFELMVQCGLTEVIVMLKHVLHVPLVHMGTLNHPAKASQNGSKDVNHAMHAHQGSTFHNHAQCG